MQLPGRFQQALAAQSISITCGRLHRQCRHQGPAGPAQALKRVRKGWGTPTLLPTAWPALLDTWLGGSLLALLHSGSQCRSTRPEARPAARAQA